MSTFVTGGQGSEDALVTDSHENIDHTAAPLSLLDGPGHSAVNHAGIPGVGDLTTAAHASLNHAGIPGVGDLTTAAHASLDHTGIPGVGGTVASNFTVLETTATATDINTALSTYKIVYLKRGTYPLLTTTIQMPTDTALVCLSSGPDGTIGTGSALFQVNSDITCFNMQGGNRIEGIAIQSSHAGTQNVITAGGSGSFQIIKRCYFNLSAWTGRIISSELGGVLHLEDVGIHDVVRTGSQPCIKNRPSISSNSAVAATFKNVQITFASSGAGSRQGIFSQDGATFINCHIRYASSHGFDFQENGSNTTLVGCSAVQCVGNGFEHSNTSNPYFLSILGCNARLNTGKGFNLPFGTATVIGTIVGSVAQTNTGGNTVNAAYLNSGNAFI